MKIIIEADPKEIADLVLAVQDRQGAFVTAEQSKTINDVMAFFNGLNAKYPDSPNS